MYAERYGAAATDTGNVAECDAPSVAKGGRGDTRKGRGTFIARERHRRAARSELDVARVPAPNWRRVSNVSARVSFRLGVHLRASSSSRSCTTRLGIISGPRSRRSASRHRGLPCHAPLERQERAFGAHLAQTSKDAARILKRLAVRHETLDVGREKLRRGRA